MRRPGLLLLILLGCSCVSQGIRPLKPLEVPVAPYQDIVTTSLTGSLMYEGGCLLFRDDTTKARFLPVWPLRSTFNGTSVFFHQPGRVEQRIVLGEEFLIEGYSRHWPNEMPAYYIPFKRQCGAEPFFVSNIRPAN